MHSDERTQKEEIRTGIRAIWRHVSVFRRELSVLLMLGLLSSVANGSVPYITGRFFDALIAVSKNETQVSLYGLPLWGVLLGVWVVIQFIANNIDWIMDRLRRRIDNKIHLTIQAQGFIHLLRVPLSYHKNAHINGELQKLSQAGWRISAIVRVLISLGPELLSVIIGITLAATINVLLASVLVTGVFLYALLLLRILYPIASIDSAAHRSWSDSWDDAASAVDHVESVKQAAAEAHETEKIKSALLVKTYGLWNKLELIWSNVGFFQRMIVFLTQLTVFALSVTLVAKGDISIGELVALNGYALMFFGPFVSLGYSWQVLQNGVISAAHAEEIFKEREEDYTPTHARALEVTGDVAFNNVSFTYGEHHTEVLSEIDFHVKAGDVVAFVGESGVGKSTAISLISGYNFPSKGTVTIDGISTRDFTLTALRKQIAVVPQEVALFNDTIKANIKYGSFDASDEEVARAAHEAHIDEFISTLPQGYETVVGERGVKLSVGQKQRVAIARAILRRPAILILDEPTSALDAKTEQLVTEALERLMRGQTTFIIAHRLSTVRKADMILVFEKGKIVESGSHSELVAREGGVYRKLYEYQVGLH